MMCVVEGLTYTELMDMHFDEFLQVRECVVDISNRRQAEVRAMRRA